MYSERDIQEIRNRINLVDLVSEYTTLKRSGRSLRGLCPFHTEKTPSFYVDPEKQLYHCFGCGAGGDIFDFVMDMEKLNFNEAVEYLAERAGITLTRVRAAARTGEKDQAIKALERAAELYRIYLFKSEAGKEAVRYLFGRGISLTSIKEFELGLSPEAPDAITKKLLKEGFKERHLLQANLSLKSSRGLVDRFRGRIMFPIRDIKDRVVGFGGRQFTGGEPKYLNTSETEFFKKSSLLYNLNRAKRYLAEAGKVIVVEGYTDVIMLHQAGIPYVVATLGTALTEVHLSLLARFVRDVYLAFDSDSAGQKAAERGIELISKAGKLNIKVIIIPEGKDPADFVKTYGEKAREKFIQLIKEAEPLEDFVLKRRLKGLDLLDPGQKRQAAEIVSDVLKIIDDPVVRDEYIKKYSLLLGVSEETLRSKLSKPLWYNINREGSVRKNVGTPGKASAEEAESRFFALLYRDYRGRIKKALENLKPEHFFDDIYRLIYAEIQSSPEECASTGGLVERVRARIGEDAVKRLSPILISVDDSSEEDERIFNELIVYLKERLIKRRLSEIRLKILEAESRGDFEAALSYARKQQELINLLKGNQI